MALPTIYHYDGRTGRFLSEGLAEQSPADPPGTWLVPAYATDIAPPAPLAEGEAAFYIGGEWEVFILPPPPPEATPLPETKPAEKPLPSVPAN